MISDASREISIRARQDDGMRPDLVLTMIMHDAVARSDNREEIREKPTQLITSADAIRTCKGRAVCGGGKDAMELQNSGAAACASFQTSKS